MLHHKKTQWLFIIVSVLTLMLGACTLPVAQTGESALSLPELTQPVTLRVSFVDDPSSVDPAFSIDGLSTSVMASLFVTLTDVDPETQATQPMLAERWEANATQDEWIFYLRRDIPWVRYDVTDGSIKAVTDENGKPRMVTGHDVVYGVQRVLDPRTAAAYPNILYMMNGAIEVNSADPSSAEFADLMAAVGVEAVDEWTVRFKLRGSASYWPQIMAAAAIPQPQWTIDAVGDTWTEPETIVTNGAYVLSRWIHNDQIVLDKNPLWPLWGEENAGGNVERIDSVILADRTSAFALYEDNKLDFVGLRPEQIDYVRADAELNEQVLLSPINCTDALVFQTQKFPTDDVHVRRALSMAVDRQTLIDVLKSTDIPANTATNPRNFGSAALDPEIAPWALSQAQGGLGFAAAVALGKQEFEAAGYPDGAGLEINLIFIADDSMMLYMQAIQSMWQSSYPALKVILEPLEQGAFFQIALDPSVPVEGTANVISMMWCADYPHAHNWLYDEFSPTGGLNPGRLSVDDGQVGDTVAAFDQLLQDALVMSADTSIEIYREAEQLLVEDIVALAPLSYPTMMSLHKPWVAVHYDAMRFRFHRWQIDPVAQMAAR